MEKHSILSKSEGIYTFAQLDKLYEETSQQLRTQTWDRVAARVKSQHLKTTYMGVDKNGDILFKTTSGTTPGKYWNQRIRFRDLNQGLQILYDDITLTRREVIRLLMDGDLLVFCDDLSFKYYWSYKAWVQGYGIKKEVRYPVKRNLQLTGAVCKHLYSCLSLLPFYTNRIVKDYKAIGLIPPDWEKRRRQYLKRRNRYGNRKV